MATEGFLGGVRDYEHPADDDDWATARLHTGDVNGDGKTDLIWIIGQGRDAKVYVALRTPNGS